VSLRRDGVLGRFSARDTPAIRGTACREGFRRERHPLLCANRPLLRSVEIRWPSSWPLVSCHFGVASAHWRCYRAFWRCEGLFRRCRRAVSRCHRAFRVVSAHLGVVTAHCGVVTALGGGVSRHCGRCQITRRRCQRSRRPCHRLRRRCQLRGRRCQMLRQRCQPAPSAVSPERASGVNFLDVPSTSTITTAKRPTGLAHDEAPLPIMKNRVEAIKRRQASETTICCGETAMAEIDRNTTRCGIF
jgi:hypothetical protein